MDKSLDLLTWSPKREDIEKAEMGGDRKYVHCREASRVGHCHVISTSRPIAPSTERDRMQIPCLNIGSYTENHRLHIDRLNHFETDRLVE